MAPIFKCIICRKDIERSTKTYWINNYRVVEKVNRRAAVADVDLPNTYFKK